MDDIRRDARLAQQLLDAKRRTKRMYRQASRIAEQRREWRERRDGSSGAASACRRIDPADGKTVIEIIPPTSELCG